MMNTQSECNVTDLDITCCFCDNKFDKSAKKCPDCDTTIEEMIEHNSKISLENKTIEQNIYLENLRKENDEINNEIVQREVEKISLENKKNELNIYLENLRKENDEIANKINEQKAKKIYQENLQKDISETCYICDFELQKEDNLCPGCDSTVQERVQARKPDCLKAKKGLVENRIKQNPQNGSLWRPENVENTWKCGHCKQENDYTTYKCGGCSQPATFSNKWACERCTYFNHSLEIECEVCGYKNNNLIDCPKCNKRKINRNSSDQTCEACKATSSISNHKEQSKQNANVRNRQCKGCHKSYNGKKRELHCLKCTWYCNNQHCAKINYLPKTDCGKCGLKMGEKIKLGNDVLIKVQGKYLKMWQCFKCGNLVPGKLKCNHPRCGSNRPVPPNKICYACRWVSTSSHSNCASCQMSLK